LTTSVSIDRTWNLRPTTHSNPPTAGNRCTVTFLNIDVTNDVLSALNSALGTASGQLDAELSRGANLRPRMEQLWSALNEPVQIAQSAWLALRPTSVGVTPFSADDNQLRAGISLSAKPSIILGAKPSTVPSALPNAIDVPGGNQFSIQLPVDAQYGTISRQIDSLFQLSHGGLRYPAVGSYYVKPTDLQLYGYGTKAVLRVRFEGSAKGVIYLVGTPSYDAVRNILSVPDLDYTFETKNVLLKLAKWTEGDRLRADLRNRLTLKLGPEVAAARALAISAINRHVGPVALSGRIDDLRILELYVQPDSGRFRMLASAVGALDVSVP
jgi:hypothetical protein